MHSALPLCRISRFGWMQVVINGTGVVYVVGVLTEKAGEFLLLHVRRAHLATDFFVFRVSYFEGCCSLSLGRSMCVNCFFFSSVADRLPSLSVSCLRVHGSMFLVFVSIFSCLLSRLCCLWCTLLFYVAVSVVFSRCPFCSSNLELVSTQPEQSLLSVPHRPSPSPPPRPSAGCHWARV